MAAELTIKNAMHATVATVTPAPWCLAVATDLTKDCAQFDRVSIESLRVVMRREIAVQERFQPQFGFVSFLDHHTQFRDELAT